MISENLLKELHQLNRGEKLRIVQMLVNQLAEETEMLEETEYDVWSPFDAPEAVAILQEMKEKESGDSNI